jgi:hypothetical protein
MTLGWKLIIGVTMALALLFGFLDPLWPDAAISFKRLHVFLFNLVSGGMIIVFFSERRGTLTAKSKLYFLLTMAYALSAAARLYPLTLALSVPLLALLEVVRIRRFSFFPTDFFSREVPVSDKFHHAAHLCLSMAVAFASLVILNNEYLQLVAYRKLTLDVFFLGYSFPLSLVTMSVMFHFMTERRNALVSVLEEVAFWAVNLGVITFFVFIIFEVFVLEITAALTLFLTVCMIFYLFVRTAPSIQQKTFLVSGMSFLLLTGLTGVFYIVLYFFPEHQGLKPGLLTMHAMVSLYGWNLSGLIIIVRWHDFPIMLRTVVPLVLHWSIVVLLAPLGKYLPAFALVAVPAYALLLGLTFVSRGTPGEAAA